MNSLSKLASGNKKTKSACLVEWFRYSATHEARTVYNTEVGMSKLDDSFPRVLDQGELQEDESEEIKTI